MIDTTIAMQIGADASQARKSLGRAEREMFRIAIEPVVVAWCPDLNAYAKASFIDELLTALGAGEDGLL